jgi:hypothetical protein
MEWFQGDIKAAIAQCQQQRAVFIVYIKGQDIMMVHRDYYRVWE